MKAGNWTVTKLEVHNIVTQLNILYSYMQLGKPTLQLPHYLHGYKTKHQ